MRSTIFVNRAGRISGAEVVMLKLIDVALDRGHRVQVVCPDGPLADQLPDGVSHLRIDELDLGGSSQGNRATALLELARRWRRAAKVIRGAVGPGSRIVVNSLQALPAARLAHPSGGVSWLVHDTISESKQRLLVRASAAVISRAVAVSPPTAEAVRALGIETRVAPLGVRIPPARSNRAVGEIPIIGIMGSVTPWKGHRVLFDALAQIPDVRLEVAGSVFHADRAYGDELVQIASRPPLAGRVSFLGHVDPLSTIANWDVLVSASTSPEAGPIVALEAMSLGVPVIGTDHGGCAWLLRDGAGVLVPPGDSSALATAIKTVLGRGPMDLAPMLASARQRVVDDHDVTKTYPAMLDALLGPGGL